MNEHNLKEFLLTHENADPALLMLHRDSRPDIDMDLAVKCISGRQVAKHKMPVWYKEPELVYPGSLPLEQCSSQATALYKQRFVKTGDKAADMTGGLGIDSWSLSGKAASVGYFEQSEELCRCARHNFRTLGRSNIIVHHTETTLEMLSGIPSCSYNIIYLDPARRNKEGNRVYSLKDCEPDVTILKRELLRIAPRILLKVSPMADIRVLLSELPEAVEIHVVSSENECKEVLVLMEKAGALISIVDVGGGLGIDYDNPDGNPVPDFERYFKIFKDNLRLKPDQQLHFEPGRSIVGQCGSLITRVLYVKEGVSKKFAIVDAGMNDLLRPALYHAHHKIDTITSDSAVDDVYDVVGPVCESSDCFANDERLSLISRGDMLALRSAGAYGEAMASRYNCRPLPGYLIE